MNRIRAAVPVGFALGGLLVAGCSGGGDAGPSGAQLGEIGSTFGQGAQKAADDFYSFIKGYEGKVEVTNDGKTEVPCELSGQAKLVDDAGQQPDGEDLRLGRGRTAGRGA